MTNCKENVPEILSLNAGGLIDWMKRRKAELGLSNAKLAELSGVPEGTIDRIMSKHYMEFRYSSVQPIMAVLIGVQENIPAPDPSDDEQNAYYYNTIEGYKLALENKNHQLEEWQRIYEHQCKEIEYLKQSNAEKQRLLERRAAHEQWLEQIVNEMRQK